MIISSQKDAICISVLPMIYWKRLIPTAKTHYLQIKLPFNMSMSAKESEFYWELSMTWYKSACSFMNFHGLNERISRYFKNNNEET